MTTLFVKFYLYNLCFILSTFTFVHCLDSEPYCNFGLCQDDQYCCRDDECCPKNESSSFLKVGIITAVIISIVLCGCLYNKCAFARYIRRSIAERYSHHSEQSFLVAKV